MWETSTNFLPQLLTLVQKQRGFLATKSIPVVFHNPHLPQLAACIFLLVSENEFSAMTLSFPHVLKAHEQSLTDVHAVPKC